MKGRETTQREAARREAVTRGAHTRADGSDERCYKRGECGERLAQRGVCYGSRSGGRRRRQAGLPGLVVVQAGEPTDLGPGMAMVRASGTAIVEQQQSGGKLVETSMSGPLRTIRKERRLMVLSGKWRCMYCKAFHERISESTTCSSCGAPTQQH